MRGRVNAHREAIVRLQAYGRYNARRGITAIIDTGYSGSLTLPPAVIRSLGLRRLGRSPVELGDGRVVSFDFYAGVVAWGGRRVAIEIDEARTAPLIGMALLDGHELNIHVQRDGVVNIARLR